MSQESSPAPSAAAAADAYHNESKHHFRRYAPGPGGLDWLNQPDPYRKFTGAEEVPLALHTTKLAAKTAYPALYAGIKEKTKADAMDKAAISSFLYHSMALSAKKVAGKSSWCLRVNPSSGNLHPTEAYLLADRSLAGDAPAVDDSAVSGAVYHYRPDRHSLERRCSFDGAAFHEAVRVNDRPLAELLGREHFLVALTSIHWRESWKYGMRAWRYCNLDAGHACAALQFAARLHGWEVVFLVPSAATAAAVGIDREGDFPVANEREHLDAVGVVLPAAALARIGGVSHFALSDAALAAVAEGDWKGTAEKLSDAHGNDWPQIIAVEAATRLPTTAPALAVPSFAVSSASAALQSSKVLYAKSRKKAAAAIVRQRRSALDMVPDESNIALAQFYGIAARLVPSLSPSPWHSMAALWAGRPRVHLLFFVHRVKGTRPGLYFLGRDMAEEDLAALQARASDKFEWERPDSCPDGMQLFRLMTGDARQAGKDLSCGQDIGGEGAFAVAMLADTDRVFSRGHDCHEYKRLYWEAGAVGQVLYLEAEANELRGTGIGCFFDDPTHQLFYGESPSAATEPMPLQSIYHFAFGSPVLDTRLRTADPYAAAK